MSTSRKGGKNAFSRPKPGKKDHKSDKSAEKLVRKDKSSDDDDKNYKRRDDKWSNDKPRFKRRDEEGGSKFNRKQNEGSKDKPRLKRTNEDNTWKKDKFKSTGRDTKKGGRDDKKGFQRKDDAAWKKDKFKSDGYDKKKFGRTDTESGKKDKSKSNDRYGKKEGWKKSSKSAYDNYMNEDVDFDAKKKSFEKGKNEYNRLLKKSEKNIGRKEDAESNDGSIRLNRYIANSGICSRRDADKLIEAGAVKVNGVVVTKLGTKVKPGDKVQYGDQTIKTEKNVYILLNKPKDYITTMDDPEGRKTVMGLIRGAARERVYPVGRLDRNTTGVLLFTNDGELTRRLTHPKFLVSKMYHVELDKNFSREDLVKMREGLELEDGFIKPDQLEYTGDSKRELGIEIHSGRNRIVRRMFEHLGYTVIKLDRVMFAGLNKKDIPRGKWRFLSEKEVGFLKML